LIPSLLEILAQGTTQPATTQAVKKPGWAEFLSSPLTLIMACFLIFYVFIIRSKKKQDTSRRDMLNQLKKGDRIQTIGGILGTVIEAREDEVLVKVDESSNTKMRFVRSAIHRVVDESKDKEKAVAKPA
jgi:preprotein translocase subunit YajC